MAPIYKVLSNGSRNAVIRDLLEGCELDASLTYNDALLRSTGSALLSSCATLPDDVSNMKRTVFVALNSYYASFLCGEMTFCFRTDLASSGDAYKGQISLRPKFKKIRLLYIMPSSMRH